jgi:hypothetical protein
MPPMTGKTKISVEIRWDEESRSPAGCDTLPCYRRARSAKDKMCESRPCSVSVSFGGTLAAFFFAIVVSYLFREPRNVMPPFSTLARANSGVVSLYAAFSTGSPASIHPRLPSG